MTVTSSYFHIFKTPTVHYIIVFERIYTLTNSFVAADLSFTLFVSEKVLCNYVYSRVEV